MCKSIFILHKVESLTDLFHYLYLEYILKSFYSSENTKISKAQHIFAERGGKIAFPGNCMDNYILHNKMGGI